MNVHFDTPRIKNNIQYFPNLLDPGNFIYLFIFSPQGISLQQNTIWKTLL